MEAYQLFLLPSKPQHVSTAMSTRKKAMRFVLFISAFFILLSVVVLALDADSVPRQFFRRTPKTPQQKYLEERKRYPSQFKRFKSTLNRIRAPEDFDNPDVFDDPRFEEWDERSRIPRPKIFFPYPDYESEEWQKTHRGTFHPCVGPRGKLLNESFDDQVGVYVGLPEGFPKPVFGSHDTIGLDDRLSFDRYSRYGPYGFGEEEEGEPENWIRPTKVEWNQTNWGALQRECVARNVDRFYVKDGDNGMSFPYKTSKSRIAPEPRTVVLIRTYTGKVYSENDKHVIRSMITELALQSGGEYEVVLLVHVRDNNVPIQQKETYQRVLKEHVPEEFWGIAKLWNVPMVAARYSHLDPSVVDVHHSQWLPIQHFMLEHQEFEYFWNWEIDARFTGHMYEFTDKVAEFGRKQPRRGLWERNERFYIPKIHGDYDSDFREFVDRRAGESVWGPLPIERLKPVHIQAEEQSPPAKFPSQDNYEWGVGEEADYLGFLPIFNPINTDWVIRNEVVGYLGVNTPRRAVLITHSRVSRRLLMAMDKENLLGRHMGSELFPPTVALLYGFKGVTVPHPIYSDRPLPAERLDRWFNSGIDGRAGSSKDSPFSWGREARFEDLSWYYRSNLPGRLYWNFLGWEKEGTGGESYENRYGRVCLPSIFFHPVKDVDPNADSTHYRLPV